MSALETSRLDLAQVLTRFPNSAAQIRRLVLADEGFRSLCEDYAWARATLTKLERSEPAEKYAKENNMGNNHSYQVREVNFRYQVRQRNDLTDELLHTSRTFNNAYEYVVEYSSSHSDLIIYDLKTGKTFGETP